MPPSGTPSFPESLPGKESLSRTSDCLVLKFPSPRHVISTSWLNGGFRRDLSAVFNHQVPKDFCSGGCDAVPDIREYLAKTAVLAGLDPGTSAGLMTAADMDNSVVASEHYRKLAVSAIVTAGIDVNGCRAGDPPSYYEDNGHFSPVTGTVNTILMVNAALPEYAHVRAVMTATEAKAAALQALMAPSRYSSGIATGSGTDMIAVVTDPASRIRLSDAGTHSVLGSLIAASVSRAVTTALERETGLSPASQMDVLVRLSRFSRETAGNLPRPGTPGYVQTTDPVLVAATAACLHLADEASWGLIPGYAAKETAMRIIRATLRNPGTAVLVPEGPPEAVIPGEILRALQGQE
jgi:adenosylcobinamide hydrolase